MEGFKVRISEPYSERIPNFCLTKELKKGQISNLLKNEIEEWQPDTPVLIDPQPALVKLHLYINALFPVLKNKI